MVKDFEGVTVYYDDYRDTDQSADIVVTEVVLEGGVLASILPYDLKEQIFRQYRELILQGG